MRQAGRIFISLFIILILLPYVITVIFHGKNINVGKTDWETYLLGELAEEISGDSSLEAVKAQAVIARTRIYKRVEEGEDPEELYVNPKQAEKTWGASHYEEYYKKFKEAIQSTEHQVLMYENTLIDAAYHQVSAGSTRNAKELGLGDGFDYLQGKTCEHDSEADTYIKEQTFSAEELAEKLSYNQDPSDGDEADQTQNNGDEADQDPSEDNEIRAEDISIGASDSAGYALTVQVGTETMSGESFRNKLGLSSSFMEFSVEDDQLVVTTKGIGHGLGLSQYGAQQMATEGSGYREILEYFYTDAEIADGGALENDKK